MNKRMRGGDSHGHQQKPKENPLLSFLMSVRNTFEKDDKGYKYPDFLQILHDFKDEKFDTPTTVERVKPLFEGHPHLLLGFNTFLPKRYQTTYEEAYNLVNKEDHERRRLRNSGKEVTQSVQNEEFAELFGPEKCNLVPGHGTSVEWASAPRILTMQSEVLALKAAYEEQREVNKQTQAEMERIKKEAAEREEALRREYAVREEQIMRKLYDLEVHIMNYVNAANSLGAILAAAGTVESLQQSQGTTPHVQDNVVPMEDCYVPEPPSELPEPRFNL